MRIIGIHLDPPFIRASLICKGRHGAEIIALKGAPLHTPGDVKQLYIKNFNGRIASSLPAKGFLIRFLQAQGLVGRHAEEAIAFQADAMSHLNPEEVITTPVIGEKEILLVTATKETLHQHLAELGKLSIDPDAVSIIPAALHHFARWKFPNVSDAFLVDIGSHETSCVWIEKGALKKAHSIPIGAETLIAALFEDRKKVLLRKEIEGAAKQIDLLLLKPGLNPHLTGTLGELKQEIGKIFYSFVREERRPVIVTGRMDAFIHLKEFLVEESDHLLTLEEQLFAVAIGLALEQMAPQSIQLRRAEFFPKKNWHRMGLYACTILTLSFLLSGAFLGFALWKSHEKKSEMIHSFQLNGRGTIEEKIDHWIASVETNNKEYPYLLQAPRVAEVLSWLSSHPLLEQMKQEADPIDIKEIRYELVKFPKIDSPKEPYLAKVEVEFRFNNVMNARKFHDALREGDRYVDKTKEITWELVGDRYRTTFFLKNRSSNVL